MGRYVPRSGWAEQKLYAKAAAEKQQCITLVNQSFDERKIVVMRSDASDKTAKQNESDDHFRLADLHQAKQNLLNECNPDFSPIDKNRPKIAAGRGVRPY